MDVISIYCLKYCTEWKQTERRALHFGDYCKNIRALMSLLLIKSKKIHYFSRQVQTLKVLADTCKETKTGQTAKSVITPYAHNPLLTDAAVPETAASDQIRNELLNLQFSAWHVRIIQNWKCFTVICWNLWWFRSWSASGSYDLLRGQKSPLLGQTSNTTGGVIGTVGHVSVKSIHMKETL